MSACDAEFEIWSSLLRFMRANYKRHFFFFFLTVRCVGVGNIHIFEIFSENLQNFEIPFR